MSRWDAILRRRPLDHRPKETLFFEPKKKVANGRPWSQVLTGKLEAPGRSRGFFTVLGVPDRARLADDKH